MTWTGGRPDLTAWIRIGEARACSNTPVPKQKALRTDWVGRRFGTPSVLKPRQLLLILGFLVTLQLTRAKNRLTCLRAWAIGRRLFEARLWLGRAMLTDLVDSPVVRLVLLNSVPCVPRILAMCLPVMPTRVLIRGCLLVGKPFRAPTIRANLFPPLRQRIWTRLRVPTLLVSRIVLSVREISVLRPLTHRS